MEGALSNLRQFSTQSVGKWMKMAAEAEAVSLLRRMFPTFSVARCHITFSKPMRLPSRYHAKGPIGAEALPPKMQIDGSKLRHLCNCNEYYVDLDINLQPFSLLRFSACNNNVVYSCLFYSFHAIYAIFIEAGRFLYPGHEVGQFDDEKRDQMDMAHLACLSWKAGCFWHLFLDLARDVSWKCTVNFVRDG